MLPLVIMPLVNFIFYFVKYIFNINYFNFSSGITELNNTPRLPLLVGHKQNCPGDQRKCCPHQGAGLMVFLCWELGSCLDFGLLPFIFPWPSSARTPRREPLWFCGSSMVQHKYRQSPKITGIIPKLGGSCKKKFYLILN